MSAEEYSFSRRDAISIDAKSNKCSTEEMKKHVPGTEVPRCADRNAGLRMVLFFHAHLELHIRNYDFTPTALKKV